MMMIKRKEFQVKRDKVLMFEMDKTKDNKKKNFQNKNKKKLGSL